MYLVLEFQVKSWMIYFLEIKASIITKSLPVPLKKIAVSQNSCICYASRPLCTYKPKLPTRITHHHAIDRVKSLSVDKLMLICTWPFDWNMRPINSANTIWEWSNWIEISDYCLRLLRKSDHSIEESMDNLICYSWNSTTYGRGMNAMRICYDLVVCSRREESKTQQNFLMNL